MSFKPKRVAFVGPFENQMKNIHLSLRPWEIKTYDNLQIFEKKFDHFPSQVLVIHADMIAKNPKEMCLYLVSFVGNRIPILVMIRTGQEKIAVIAKQNGISDVLTEDEMIPQLLMMTLNRAVEHKKWENLHQVYLNKNDSSTLVDEMTGAFSRPYLEARIKEELKRSERYRFAVSLIVFRITDESTFQVSFGNDCMQQMKKELVLLLKRTLRSSDLLASMDGSIFIILMPHTNEQQAELAWNRILKEVHPFAFTHPEGNFYIDLSGKIIPLNSKEKVTLENIIDNSMLKND